MDLKDKKLQKLQAKWYKKLERTGFVDQERVKYGEHYLKEYSGKLSDRHEDGSPDRSLESIPGIGQTHRFNYYQRCREFLLEYKFKNKTERKIFELHSEGISIRDIATELKTYRDKVHKTIRRLVKEMLG